MKKTVKTKNNRRLILYFAFSAVTLIMVLCAEILKEREIIFPEIAALCAGALLAPKVPWRLSKPKMLFLMSVSAAVGLIIVRLPIHLYFKIVFGLVISFCILILSKTTMIPLISACVLPILLNTTSAWYFVSVVIMTAVVIALRIIFEKIGLVEKEDYLPVPITAHSALTMFKKLLILLAVAALPAFFVHPFFIAPPIIVAFCEMSEVDSPARKTPVKIGIICLIAITAGSVSRILFDIILKVPFLPLAVCTVVATAVLLVTFCLFKIYFPPAGALAILPILLPDSKVFFYLPEACIGVCLMIFAAMFLFSEKYEKNTEKMLDKAE